MGHDKMTLLSQDSRGNSLKTQQEPKSTSSHLSLGSGTSEDPKTALGSKSDYCDKCDYLDLETCSNLNPNNYNLLVLQINIRSLLAHQLELNKLIRMTEKKTSQIDIILLCETFLSKQTVNVANVPGFTHIDNYRRHKEGGGVSILIREGILFKCR